MLLTNQSFLHIFNPEMSLEIPHGADVVDLFVGLHVGE